MRKLFAKFHLWLSVPFGLIITIICFTGSMLVFEREVTEMVYRDRYYVEKIGEQPLPVDVILRNVSATLPDSVSVNGVNISSDPSRTYQVTLSKPKRASVFVNQYTGEVLEPYKRAPFFSFMFRMHRWLLDSPVQQGKGSVGKTIVGVSTLIFVLILITGIVIWVPRSGKMLKNRLSVATDKGLRRFWYDSHVSVGFYATLLLLAMSLTGLTWSFSWYREGFYKVFGVVQQAPPHAPAKPGNEKPQSEERGVQGRPSDENSEAVARGNGEGRPQRGNREGAEGRGNDRPGEEPAVQERGERQSEGKPAMEGRSGKRPVCATWQKVYDQLKQQVPDYKQISVSNGSANVSFNKFGNQRGADKYNFDQSGNITDVVLYSSLDKSGKIRGWIYTVHVGSWGGLLSKILTVLAALIGASLPLTGYYLWIKRSWKKKK